MVKGRSIAVAIAGGTIASACTLLYANYDDRFGAAADAGAVFVNDDAAIRHVAVTADGVTYDVGSEVRRVSLDGGSSVVVWTGDGGAASSVLGLASDGVDTVVWTYGNGSQSDAVFSVRGSAPVNAINADGGRTPASAVALDVATIAWSLGGAATCTGACLEPVVEKIDRGDGTAATFDLTTPDGGARTALGVKALAIDSAGLSAIVSDATFVRFDRVGGALSCKRTGFVTNGAIAGLAVGPGGSPLFVLVASESATTSGPVQRYEGACPAAADAGATIASSAVVLVGDTQAAYWATESGEVWRRSFEADASTLLGATPSGANALAVGGSYVYAAAGTTLYRFPTR